MSKILAKIVAHTNISSHVQDLLATCLKIPIPSNINKIPIPGNINKIPIPGNINKIPIPGDINKYTWVENCAGVHIGKIKQGEYSIYTLHGVLYSMMYKMIESNSINSKPTPTKFMLFSGNNPISLMVGTISRGINKRHGIISKNIMNVIYNNTFIIDQPVIRLVKCGDIYIYRFCEAANKYDVFDIYKRPNSDNYTQYYIKIIYDASGIKYVYHTHKTQYYLDLIKDLFSHEIHNYVVKYYNSYIYNKLHNIPCIFDKSVLSKLCKLYYEYIMYVLKGRDRWKDPNHPRYKLYGAIVYIIKRMCRDRISTFKSIGRYVPTGPVALLFEL
jgi:hypothetical protein